MKVLIVDGQAFLAELVKLALEADGHLSTVVASVAEATEILRSMRVDLITIDLTAAGDDPLTWLEATVLAHAELQGRIFVLNGGPLPLDTSTRLLACGATVLEKPVTLSQIRDIVGAIAPTQPARTDAKPREPSIEA